MKKTRFKKIIILTTCLLATSVKAEHVHDRADSHAPIGVMGDHIMPKGDWMLTYRFMSMQMEDLRSVKDSLDSEQVAAMVNTLAGEKMHMGNLPDGSPRMVTVPGNYRIVPLEMDMRMHMVGLMVGFSHDITGIVMFNYVQKTMTSMTYKGMMGTATLGSFTGKTSGIGDTKVSALIRVGEGGIHNLHLNAGISIPTGSITESGSVLPPFAGMLTPAGELLEIDRFAYNMQLGSGTIDLEPGITYTARQKDFSWGSQALATLRMYDNKEGYRLGNMFEGSVWLAQQWQQWLSTSARIRLKSEGSIKGRDRLITGGSPVANAENSERDEATLLLGINLLGTGGGVSNHRFALELGAPIYESVNGVQMSTRWSAALGWQAIF